MWQDDTITFQTSSIVNNYGSETVTWSDTANVVLCDVQDINKELVFKKYGFIDTSEFKQIFDHTQSSLWVKGSQVKFNDEQWWVKLVNGQLDKIGASDHVFVILSKVI